jgi:hypothetical protein
MNTTQNIPPMLITDTGITVFLNNQMIVAPSDHLNFERVREAIANYEFDLIEGLLDLRKVVVDYLADASDGFELRGDFLCLDNKPFTMDVTDKVLAMIDAGQPADPIYSFLRKVRQNPLVSAQDELLLFCVANSFMIHEDGDIIAYKSVRGDYTDIHSGKFLNRVGSTLEMDRTTVDADRNRTCSVGFHFAAYDYATTWAGRIDGVSRRLLVMKINPSDIVAIPSDYNNQKGRTFRYTILSEIHVDAPLPKKEVYTNADLGVPASTDVSEYQTRLVQADKLRITAQLDRKSELVSRLTNELSELEMLIEELEINVDKVNAKIKSLRAAYPTLPSVADDYVQTRYDLTSQIRYAVQRQTRLNDLIPTIQDEMENLHELLNNI